jgi:hypothetical protein
MNPQNKDNFPVVLKEVLPFSLFHTVFCEMTEGWSLTNFGYADDGTKFWAKNDKYSLVFLEAASIIKLKIQKNLQRDITLCRIHCNAQTQNQVSKFHQDSNFKKVWTFVLFTQWDWNTDWGGEFVCLNPYTKEYNYVPYIPNNGVLIPSHWEHVGRSPVQTQEVRTSIGFSYVIPEYAHQAPFLTIR